MSVIQGRSGTQQFLPPWYFRNGHIQTLAGLYVFSPRASLRGLSVSATMGEIALDDGDRLVYHDDCPAEWKPGDRIALLLHGLGGSHASPYLVRIAGRLNQLRVRTFRLDWRGCGAGAALARYPYHSGRSEDLDATIRGLQNRCPGSAVSLIGFSLGGNVALKWLGELSRNRGMQTRVDRAVAVCPPIDLHFTVSAMRRGWGKLYDRYFCKGCIQAVRHRRGLRPDTVVPEGWFSRQPRTLYEFDDTFTAPVSGFQSADDYYARSSANQFLSSITVPTLVLAAQDDPLIPYEQFRIADYSGTTELLAPTHGGHLGFCNRRGQDWLDEQVIAWSLGR